MSATAAKATDRPPLGLSAAAGRPVAEVFDRLGTSEAGLAGTDAEARLRTFGANVLPARPVTAWGVLLGQLRNPLLFLLLAAAAISAFTGERDRRGHHRRHRGPERRARASSTSTARRAAVAALHANIHHEALVVAGRPPARGRRQRARARRRRRAARRRRGPGRPAAGRGRPARVRRGGADRRVDGGGQGGRAGRRPDSAVDLPSCAFMGTVVHQGAGQGVVVSTGARHGVRRDRGRARRAPGRDGVPGRACAGSRAARAGGGAC